MAGGPTRTLRPHATSAVTRTPLVSLTRAHVLHRHGGNLRVTPRFLAHMEGTTARLRLMGHGTEEAILEAALRTWDDHHGDPRRDAVFLHTFLSDRDQLGFIRPVFPSLEGFAANA